ncbi:MAG: M28 family peptidase [Luteitalea sp.]|nr:M28 family peptidase [Luteitalea sp.]
MSGLVTMSRRHMPRRHLVTRALLVAIAAVSLLGSEQPSGPHRSAANRLRQGYGGPPSRFALRRTRPPKLYAKAEAAPYPGLEQITAADLRSHLTFIAADELEGRSTPSRGLDTAARYIASHLSRWGLEPAGDSDTYFQRIVLVARRVDRNTSRVTLGRRAFTHGEDFLAGSTPGKMSGPLVYVGHGHVIKERRVNPYAGLDIKGKVIVAHDALPDGVRRADLKGKKSVDWDDPMSAAERLGAVGIVYLPSYRTLTMWRRTAERPMYAVEKFQSDERAPLPSITASAALVGALFDDEKVTPEAVLAGAISGKPAKPFALEGRKVLTATVALTTRHAQTQNVVAVVEGADPKLRHECVALGAHYDHVGLGTGSGDIIYNGADDDGSGTTALLAMAEVFATVSPRPKRSVLFTWHAGEERGLWGSEYFTRFPTVPLDRIVAQLNIDMIGRSRKPGDTNPANSNLTGPDATYVIGSTLMSTELERISRDVNAGLLNLKFDYKYDAPDDRERLFYRSDHYNYAKHNIPVIFYFSGLHEDYHDVGDSADKIDYAKMEKVARTIYATARTLADRPRRPAVDKELPQRMTGEQ